MIDWLNSRDWTYLGDCMFNENDCETEDGYRYVHSIMTKWYYKEEANIGEI